MQSATRLHNGVANAILQEAYLVFHHPIAFHRTNGVFNADSDRRNRAIGRLLRWGEFTLPRFFLWQGITLQIGQVHIICLPFIRGTQEANVTGLIDHEKVLDRVALLRAAVVVLLVLGIAGAVDRSLSAIMPKRGG
jgi:hypothetical protein